MQVSALVRLAHTQEAFRTSELGLTILCALLCCRLCGHPLEFLLQVFASCNSHGQTRNLGVYLVFAFRGDCLHHEVAEFHEGIGQLLRRDACRIVQPRHDRLGVENQKGIGILPNAADFLPALIDGLHDALAATTHDLIYDLVAVLVGRCPMPFGDRDEDSGRPVAVDRRNGTSLGLCRADC